MKEKRVAVLATVIEVHDTHTTYPSCVTCYSKLLIDPISARYHCIRCATSCDKKQVKWRYRLALLVSDGVSSGRVVVFGTTLDVFFGKNATDFTRSLDDLDKSGYPAFDMLSTALLRVFHGKYFFFGFKIPSETTYNTSVLQHVLKTETSLFESQLDCTSDFEKSHTVAYQMLPSSDVIFTTVTGHMRLLVRWLRNKNKSVNSDTINELNSVTPKQLNSKTANQLNSKTRQPSDSSQNNKTTSESFTVWDRTAETTSDISSAWYFSDQDSVKFSFEKSNLSECKNTSQQQVSNCLMNKQHLDENGASLSCRKHNNVTCCSEKEQFLGRNNENSGFCASGLCSSVFGNLSVQHETHCSFQAVNEPALLYEILPEKSSARTCMAVSRNHVFTQMPVTQKLNFSLLKDSSFDDNNTSKRIDKELIRRELVLYQKTLPGQKAYSSNTQHTDYVPRSKFVKPFRCSIKSSSFGELQINPKMQICKGFKEKNIGHGEGENDTREDGQCEPVLELDMPESEDFDAFFDSQFEEIELNQVTCGNGSISANYEKYNTSQNSSRLSHENFEESVIVSENRLRQQTRTEGQVEVGGSSSDFNAKLEFNLPQSEALDEFFQSFEQFSINDMEAPVTFQGLNPVTSVHSEYHVRTTVERSLVSEHSNCAEENSDKDETYSENVNSKVCTTPEKKISSSAGDQTEAVSILPEESFGSVGKHSGKELEDFFHKISLLSDSINNLSLKTVAKQNIHAVRIKEVTTEEVSPQKINQITCTPSITEVYKKDMSLNLVRGCLCGTDSDQKIGESSIRETNSTKEVNEIAANSQHTGQQNTSLDSVIINYSSASESDQSEDVSSIIFSSQSNKTVPKRKHHISDTGVPQLPSSFDTDKTASGLKMSAHVGSPDITKPTDQSSSANFNKNLNHCILTKCQNLDEDLKLCKPDILNGSIDLFESPESKLSGCGGLGHSVHLATPFTCSEPSDRKLSSSVAFESPLGTSTPSLNEGQLIIPDSFLDADCSGIDNIETDREILGLKACSKQVKFDKHLRRVSSCYIMDVKMKLNESPLKRNWRVPKSCLKVTKYNNDPCCKENVGTELTKDLVTSESSTSRETTVENDLHCESISTQNISADLFDNSCDLFGNFCDKRQPWCESLSVLGNCHNTKEDSNSCTSTEVNSETSLSFCDKPLTKMNNGEVRSAELWSPDFAVSDTGGKYNKENQNRASGDFGARQSGSFRIESKKYNLGSVENLLGSATTPDLFSTPFSTNYSSMHEADIFANTYQNTEYVKLADVVKTTLTPVLPDSELSLACRDRNPVLNLFGSSVSSSSTEEEESLKKTEGRIGLLVEDTQDIDSSQFINITNYKVCDHHVKLVPKRNTVLCKKLFF